MSQSTFVPRGRERWQSKLLCVAGIVAVVVVADGAYYYWRNPRVAEFEAG